MGSEFSVKNDTGNPCLMRIDEGSYNPLPAGHTRKNGKGPLSMNYRVYVIEKHPDGDIKHYCRCFNAVGANHVMDYTVKKDFGQERLDEFGTWSW